MTFRNIAAMLLVGGLTFQAAAQTPVLTVLARDGRKPVPITAINNQEYVAVDDVNTAFGTTSREDRVAGGLIITARTQSIVLTADQNVVSVGGRLVSLPAPVLRRMEPATRRYVEAVQLHAPSTAAGLRTVTGRGP